MPHRYPSVNKRSSRLFRFYLSSPATPFLSLPYRPGIEWPALPPPPLPPSLGRDGQILNFSPSCVPITGQREREREIPSLYPATIKFYNRRTGIFIDVAARRRFFSSREPHRVFPSPPRWFRDRYAAEIKRPQRERECTLRSIFRRRLKGKKERKEGRKRGRVVVPREDDFAGR